MASAFICASLSIRPTVRHADYLGAWLASRAMLKGVRFLEICFLCHEPDDLRGGRLSHRPNLQ